MLQKEISCQSVRSQGRSLARPQDIDLPDAMFQARHARNRGVDAAVVLEEVEMAPRLLGEVRRRAEPAAGRAGVADAAITAFTSR